MASSISSVQVRQCRLDRRVVAGVVFLLVILSGIYVAPFDWEVGAIDRSLIPVDAIPDIGENQQIVFTEWLMPRDVEDQVTYPLTASLMGIPGEGRFAVRRRLASRRFT